MTEYMMANFLCKHYCTITKTISQISSVGDGNIFKSMDKKIFDYYDKPYKMLTENLIIDATIHRSK